MALPDLQLRSLARRDREAQERGALHHVVLRLFGVLSDVPQPRAVQCLGRCCSECRDAHRHFPTDAAEVERRCGVSSPPSEGFHHASSDRISKGQYQGTRAQRPGTRLPRLIEELARYKALQKRSALYRQLAKADLLLIDDFGLAPLGDETVRDLLEILDDRYDRRSTIMTSQLPVDQWHAYLGDRTVADAILDRLVHNSYRIVLKADSMRKHRGLALKAPAPSRAKR